MKKIAFFDIDGTMVNVPNGMMHPSKETIRVLKEFRKQGNYIVVATARTSAPDSVKDIDFDGYIYSDGHYIEFQNEVLVNDIFSNEQIKQQIEIYEKHNGGYMMGGAVSSHDDPYVQKHSYLYSGSKDLTGMPLVKDCIGHIETTSITAIFGNAEDLYAAKEELPHNWEINAYDTGSIRMDVHLEGFSKGTACEFLYKHLNIEKENTFAFGDGDNDIEMLKLVGHGIAMGNAQDEIKKAADDVTDTVDNDGIAKAFKKYLNI